MVRPLLLISVLLVVILLNVVPDVTATEIGKCNLWQGKCPPGWKTFARAPGKRICLRIFHQNATYLEAQNICRKQYNSRVHGIENVEEQLWLKMKSKKLITENPGYMWLGARRKAHCFKTPAQMANEEGCRDKNLRFQWDDQITTNNFMFTQWDQSIDAPDSLESNGAPEDCVVMNVHENGGFIDDKDCTLPHAGFLCGMTA